MTSYRFYIILFAFIGKTFAEYFHHYSIKKKRHWFWYVKDICKGRQKMYMKTGTYPVDKKRLQEETPLFKI